MADGTMGAVTDTCICASCGETFDKGWSDEEAAAEAEELFPGIDPSDPAEAGVVCGDCFEYIMGRARAEAPELIGEGWRAEGSATSDDPIGDALRAEAEQAREEIRAARLMCPSCGQNAGGLYGRHGLVLIKEPDRAIPVAECRDGDRVPLEDWNTINAAANIALMDDIWFRETIAFDAAPLGIRNPFSSVAARSEPGPFGSCYATASGMMVHVRPGCRCKT